MIAAWNRFWFREASTQTLGLIRLFFVGTLVSKLVGTWGIYKGWGAFRFNLPHHQSYAYGEYVNAVPGFEWLGSLSRSEFQTAEGVVLALTVCFCLGFATRVTGALVALAGVWFLLSSQWNYLHHVNVYVWGVALLAMTPCGDHYSVDALLRRAWARWKDRPARPVPPRPILHQRMMLVFLSLTYASTTWAKLGPGWFDGAVMQLMADSGWLKGPFRDAILSVTSPLQLSWWTIFAEGMLAVGLFFKPTRRFAAWCGVALHLGIDAMMNVTTFSYAMISLYLSAAEPHTGRNVVRLDRTQRSHKAAHVLLRAFDWTHRFSVQPADTGARASVTPPDQGPLRGIDAVIMVLGLLPATFLFGFWLDAGRGLLRRVRPAV